MVDLTFFLALVLFALGISLICRHGLKHWLQPDETDETTRCAWACYLQYAEITHVETWTVVCFTNALSFTVLSPVRLGFELAAGILFIVGIALVAVAGFTPQNVANHETWIVVCFTNAVIMLL